MRQTRDQQRFNAFMVNFMSSSNEDLYHPSSNEPMPNLDGYNSKTGQASYVTAPTNQTRGNVKATNAPAPPQPRQAPAHQTQQQNNRPVGRL
ncbi:hypothetical protein GPJ56_005654 [Histomonas meleagridis]|uniref:uncharacterized protein n=1 Tax=Histomonas meleagridis TaxID=135588 RepID=UPI00355ABDC6|nr:hypothetical protein GPJ56_005654 [Histomonas meleagridis]KAH0803411.1 hypothetical protein GO595_003755 [Histomonas meleagridis]